MATAGRRPYNKTRTITQAQQRIETAEPDRSRYEYNQDILPVPDYLDEEEAEVWDEVLRTAPEGALSQSSHYVLEMFCYQICQIRQIRAEMKQLKEAKNEKPKDGGKDGKSKATTPTTTLTILHNGRIAPNPLLTAYRSAVATASQLSNTLGLTGARTKRSRQDEEEDKANQIASGRGQAVNSGRQGLIGPQDDSEEDATGTGNRNKEEESGTASHGSARTRKPRGRKPA